MHRRKFLTGSTMAMAGLALPLDLLPGNKRVSANDKVNVGVIGCNGMGWSNVKALMEQTDVDLVAICDVDSNVVAKRKGEYATMRKNVPTTYSDYRELLRNKSIDAVVIGTPDHWHCKIMVDAVNAGKHVYVEKPVGNSIAECNLMVKAQEKTGKVVQAGQWQRSGPTYKKAVEIVRSGVLGQIRLVKVWAYQGWMKPMKPVADSPVPAGVDYDFWLGPAQKRPFNANRFHFNFRWFWDYAGGLMTDWGVHEIDIALYAMQAQAPISVVASGGKLAYPDDPAETPDTLQAIFQYEKFNMLWEHATGIDNGPYNRTEGIAFIGNNGTLVVNRGGYEVLVEREADGYAKRTNAKMETIEAMKTPEGVSYLSLHTKNFIDAVRKNDQSMLNTPIRSGSVAAINAQMGNIAYRTGNKLFWDASATRFKDNAAANQYLSSVYHNGWDMPTV